MSKSPQQCAPAMQHPPRPSRSGAWIRSACGFLAAILIGGPPEFASLQGAEVTMLSGYRISFEGEPKPVRGLTLEQTRVTPVGPVANFPFTIFEDGRRQIILPQRQVAEVQLGGRTVDKFNITIPPGPKVDSFGAIGGFLNVTPFSEFGRRIVTLATPRGNEDVIQAIKELRPQDITLTAVQHQWEYKVATQSIPTETLRAVLYNAIDQESHEDRLAVVRFFLDAGMYQVAQQELDLVEAKFEDLKARVEQIRLQIRQLQAMEILKEFKLRLTAGQYELVYANAQQFPRKNINAATLAEVDQIIFTHEQAIEQLDRIRAALSRLQAEIKDPTLLSHFQDMRSVVDRQLSRHTLERMTPFLQNLDDNTLKAEEKLALAYSGWVVGPALASLDPQTVIQYWHAADTVRACLRTENPLKRSELAEQLRRTEGVGNEVLTAIVQLMGPAYETPNFQPGIPFEVTSLRQVDPPSYQVLLPVEYDLSRSYPVVLTMHAEGVDPVRELLWWGGNTIAGPAHRRGMIILAPVWPASQGAGSGAVHDVALEALQDACKRFAIDADRVFLAGHGSGADAAVDLAMSHPSEFAGLISICGRLNDFAHQYWENCELLPSYFVCGELDGGTINQNAGDWSRMMKYGQDMHIVQYIQRGQEDYREELPNILDWMEIHTRPAPPQELERTTMRAGDNRFDWLEFSGLPSTVLEPQTTSSGRTIPARAMPISGTITGGNNIYLKVGASHVTLWLSPEIVSFEKRLEVRWKGRTMYNDIPERDPRTMLEHLYLTGDRRRLYWMRIDI